MMEAIGITIVACSCLAIITITIFGLVILKRRLFGKSAKPWWEIL